MIFEMKKEKGTGRIHEKDNRRFLRKRKRKKKEQMQLSKSSVKNPEIP
jgi:hypothetical protein